MKLQLDMKIFHHLLTSPANFEVIWLFLILVGAVIFFGNRASLIFTAKQVEAWWKSNFWWFWYLFQRDICILKVEIYQIFGDHLCWSIVGSWGKFSFSNSELKTFSVGQMSMTDPFPGISSFLYISLFFSFVRVGSFLWVIPAGFQFCTIKPFFSTFSFVCTTIGRLI